MSSDKGAGAKLIAPGVLVLGALTLLRELKAAVDIDEDMILFKAAKDIGPKKLPRNSKGYLVLNKI